MLDKSRLAPEVQLGGSTLAVPVPLGGPIPESGSDSNFPSTEAPGDGEEVPLIALAWARSGDKGDSSNIGVIARRPEWLPLLRGQLTEKRVKAWLAHLVQGDVTRYEVPGIHAFNFLCTRALDGGGMGSLRNDPLGKGMAQILLTLPIRVPRGLR